MKNQRFFNRKICAEAQTCRFASAWTISMKVLAVSASSRSEADETIAGLRGYVRCLLGAQEKGIIYGTGTWEMNDVYRHPAFEKAYEAGKNIGK